MGLSVHGNFLDISALKHKKSFLFAFAADRSPVRVKEETRAKAIISKEIYDTQQRMQCTLVAVPW